MKEKVPHAECRIPIVKPYITETETYTHIIAYYKVCKRNEKIIAKYGTGKVILLKPNH